MASIDERRRDCAKEISNLVNDLNHQFKLAKELGVNIDFSVSSMKVDEKDVAETDQTIMLYQSNNAYLMFDPRVWRIEEFTNTK